MTTATIALGVRNVAPVITGIAPDSPTVGADTSVTVSGTFADPAYGVSTETFTGTAVWSDGVQTPVTIVGNTFTTQRNFSPCYLMTTPHDLFTVAVTVRDDDGGRTRSPPP